MVYFHFNHVFDDVATIAQLEPTPTMSIIKFTLEGKMSEQGADKARMELYQGFKFFLKAVGIGAAFALFFWQLPALAQFILALKAAN